MPETQAACPMGIRPLRRLHQKAPSGPVLQSGGGRPPPSLGVYRLTFFVPGSVELGLQAFGVLFVIVLCVGCVLAVAAGREVAVGRRTARAGSRIPQLGA